MGTSRLTGVSRQRISFDTAEAATAIIDADGVIRGWTADAQRLLGYLPEEVLGRSVTSLLVGADKGAPAPRLRSRQGWSGLVTVRHRDGGTVALGLRVLPITEDDRSPHRVVLAVDLTRAPLRGTSRWILERMIALSPIGVAILDTELRYVWVNKALERLSSVSVERRIGRRLTEIMPGGRSAEVESSLRRVLKTGEPVVDADFVGRLGPTLNPVRAYSASVFRLEDEAGTVLGVCYLLVDASECYRAQRRVNLLNKASAGIGGSLDLTRTAQDLADVAVPELADLVFVDLLDPVLRGEEPVPGPVSRPESQPLRRAGQQSVRGGCPESVTAVGETISYPEQSPAFRCMATGEPRLEAVLDGVAAEGRTRKARAWAAQLRRFGIHSLVSVPIRARGITLGAATFCRWQREEPFKDEDVTMAGEFVSRAAVYIDNARRYTREHASALTLQRSLLPHHIPGQTAVEVASCYQPADPSTGVGGDWFDVIPLSGARVALVVGDVVGHGIHAAATMGRLRTAVQTLADLDLSPEELLAHLDDMISRLTEDDGDDPSGAVTGVIGATCLYAVYDPVSRCCALARAGHPAPMVVSPGGRVRPLDVPAGPPLGLGGLPFESAEVVLDEGSVVALYTDGLIESRALDVDVALDRMRGILSGAPHRPLQQLCDAVIGEMLGDGPVDDVALLLARTRALGDDQIASWQVDPDPAVVGRLRSAVARRLDGWGLGAMVFTTELVVSELVTNAIRYATAPIALRLIRDRTLICEVSDASSTSPHLRHARTTDEGGRGLFLIAQCTQRWGTRYTESGKTIWTEQLLPGAGTPPVVDAW